jgi:hypothetical protein
MKIQLLMIYHRRKASIISSYRLNQLYHAIQELL